MVSPDLTVWMAPSIGRIVISWPMEMALGFRVGLAFKRVVRLILNWLATELRVSPALIL